MFKGKAGYYLALVLCMAGAFWLGYFITQLIRGHSMSSTWIACAIVSALVVGLGVVYFSMRDRHGGQEMPGNIEIPCKVEDTEHIKVNNYHFVMATSKRERGIASIRSSDIVNGITVEPINRDAHPHRIRVEVRLNEDSNQVAVKEFVINAGATVDTALSLPRSLRLADISSVDIRIRQV